MNQQVLQLLSCPVCHASMTESSDGRVCSCRGARTHCFDFAKSGHIHLGGPHAGDGDTKESVLSRRSILDAGYYQPLSDAINTTLDALGVGSVLDAGCGEGYYTDIVENAIRNRDGASDVVAFDISKDAVDYAAKKNRNLKCAVFGSYHMPLPDAEFSVVTNMFSPNAKEEIFRVLRPGGIYVMAIPAAEHLYSLKAAIYENPYKNEVADTRLDGFSLLHSERVSYKINLCGKEEISALFGMTPYAYRTRTDDRRNVEALESLEVEADFLILVYKKREGVTDNEY